jgi:uncharacterized phage-associated protein
MPGIDNPDCPCCRQTAEVVMATVFDVAAYILAKRGEMTTWKLQKLIYYCQAWSLVWDERPMFNERIEAWANGPVCPALYGMHRGMFTIAAVDRGDLSNLDPAARETIDAVVADYGNKSSQWLSDLTHQEEPWRLARRGIPDGERSNSEITLGAMAEYYGRL